MPYKDPDKQKAAQAEWYKSKREERLAASRRQRKANIVWMREQKMKPCEDCGGKFHPVCMDFHHRDGEEKESGVSQAIFLVGRQKVIEEIAKCDLLCANCHRLRHLDNGSAGFDSQIPDSRLGL